MKEPKQVIVIRKDLNMRKGKMVAQGAHASMKVFLDLMQSVCTERGEIHSIYMDKGSAVDKWINGLFTKVCVCVNSEEELLEVYEKAEAKGLLCSLIEDAGLTEFNGVKTKTCIAIGPDYPENIDEITGHLKLL